MLGTLDRTLRSQRVGVVAGFAAAAALGVGSFITDRSPDLYAGLHGDDLRFFFAPVAWQHAWLYATALALGVWGLSSALCALHEIRLRMRQRRWQLTGWGVPLVHASFVAALVTHLWGGLTSGAAVHEVGPEGTAIHGATYRAVDIEQEFYPGGMPRRVTVTLTRTLDGEDQEVTVGYNRPIVLKGGAVALLLGRYGQVAGGAVLALGTDRLQLQPGQSGRLGNTDITLHRVATGRSLRVPVADLTVGGAGRTMLPLTARAPAGDELAFVDVLVTPAVILNERSNPTAPYTLALSLVLVIGVVLAGLEHVRRRR